MAQRDLVVVGTSAGGVEALPNLFAQVPADTPAAFAVVQHLGEGGQSHMPHIVQRATEMHVKWAEHGEAIEHGKVYIAAAERHLLIHDGEFRVVDGPRENHARPAINRLFRSAAAHYGGRTIGVLLTGMLDDGALGMVSIQRSGGATIVQDPHDASYPDMPRAAIEAMPPDHVVPLSGMGALLVELTREEAPHEPPPADILTLARLDETGRGTPEQMDELGPRVSLMCPDCGGPMWDVGYGRVLGYRCYLGHANGPRAILARQANDVERSLWAAVRALQERAATLGDLARAMRKTGSEQVATPLEAQARDAREHAERARQFLLELQRNLRDE